jgi:hypothetical protein
MTGLDQPAAALVTTPRTLNVGIAIPMQPCGAKNTDHLFSAKWLRQYVVGPQIQRFGPKMLICQSGAHDQKRWIRQRIYCFQHIPPATLWQIMLGDNEWKSIFLQDRQRCVQFPFAADRPARPCGHGTIGTAEDTL